MNEEKVDIENGKVDIQAPKVDIESVCSEKGSDFSVKQLFIFIDFLAIFSCQSTGLILHSRSGNSRG